MTDDSPRPAEPRRLRHVSPIYPIIDVDLCRVRGVDPVSLAAACLRGGATLLQLRQKGGASGSFLAILRAVVGRSQDVGATLVVNDRADLARMAGAQGIHVGQDDLPVAAVRAICGDDSIVGLSTHTTEQVDASEAEDIDYVAVGPIYGTTTKETGYSARGFELVRYAARGGRPVVAIGGITLATAPQVIEAGAATVAVISDLLTDADPEARVREYVKALGGR